MRGDEFKRRVYLFRDKFFEPPGNGFGIDQPVAQLDHKDRVSVEALSQGAQLRPVEQCKRILHRCRRFGFHVLFRHSAKRIQRVVEMAHRFEHGGVNLRRGLFHDIVIFIVKRIQRQHDGIVRELGRKFRIPAHQLFELDGIRRGPCLGECVERVVEPARSFVVQIGGHASSLSFESFASPLASQFCMVLRVTPHRLAAVTLEGSSSAAICSP